MNRKGSAEEMHRAASPSPFLVLFSKPFLYVFKSNNKANSERNQCIQHPYLPFSEMMCIGFTKVLCFCVGAFKHVEKKVL